VTSPDVSSPDVTSPDVSSPDVSSPDVTDEDVTSVSDDQPTNGEQQPPDPPLHQGLEALLFLADEPLDIQTIAEAVQAEPPVVRAALEELAAAYERDRRGMEIRSAGGGWRMYSADGARPVLERWALVGRSGRLTQAALETLAVIAYKQPIGRHDIGDIRGVNADGAVRSLVARGYVQEVGRDAGPGQAVLYGTTHSFLERLGLSSLEDLPPLTDYLPEAPAPDEPALGALKEIRRRLATGEDLVTGQPREGAAAASTGETATAPVDDDDHDDHLPPPGPPSMARDDGQMDALTDDLERAARSAVDRLRKAVAAEQASSETDDSRTGDPGPDDTRSDDTRADESRGEPEDG
jgi:segregation and condensation protein B